MNKPILNLIAAIILSATAIFCVWYYVNNSQLELFNFEGIPTVVNKKKMTAIVIEPKELNKTSSSDYGITFGEPIKNESPKLKLTPVK